MGRNLAYLFGIIITILVGIYFYNSCCNCCNSSAEEKDPVIATSISNEPEATLYPFVLADSGSAYEVNENFNFDVSSPSFLLPLSGSLKNGITVLPYHLIINTEVVNDIVGYYDWRKKWKAPYSSLGITHALPVEK